MKNTLKLAALALAAMALMVACKNAPEATEDTVAIDTTPIEEVVEDTMPAIDTVEVVAEPVAKKATAKKATKKEQKNDLTVTVKTDESGKTIMTSKATRVPKSEIKIDMGNNGKEEAPLKQMK